MKAKTLFVKEASPSVSEMTASFADGTILTEFNGG